MLILGHTTLSVRGTGLIARTAVLILGSTTGIPTGSIECSLVVYMHGIEGTFARHAPGAPSIQMNVPAIYHNALPPNITPSSSPGTLNTSTLYDCWQSNNFPFFRPTSGTITCTLPL